MRLGAGPGLAAATGRDLLPCERWRRGDPKRKEPGPAGCVPDRSGLGRAGLCRSRRHPFRKVRYRENPAVLQGGCYRDGTPVAFPLAPVECVATMCRGRAKTGPAFRPSLAQSRQARQCRSRPRAGCIFSTDFASGSCRPSVSATRRRALKTMRHQCDGADESVACERDVPAAEIPQCVVSW